VNRREKKMQGLSLGSIPLTTYAFLALLQRITCITTLSQYHKRLIMLLGLVCPGYMEHLCFSHSPFEGEIINGIVGHHGRY